MYCNTIAMQVEMAFTQNSQGVSWWDDNTTVLAGHPQNIIFNFSFLFHPVSAMKRLFVL